MKSILPWLLATQLFAVSVAAQTSPDGPYWNERTAPANLLSVQTFGTLVRVLTTTDVQLWSGITRTWTTIPLVSSNPSVSVFNAYVLVQDGPLLHAWTTRGTEVATLTLDPAATITSGPTSNSWVTVVVQNGQAFGFSAFRGDWVPLTLAPGTPTVVCASVTAIVDDGAQAHGFGAYEGFWSSTPSTAGAAVQVNGVVGLVTGAGVVRGFSAHRNAWSTAPWTGTNAPVLQASLAALVDGLDLLVYSGVRNEFASRTSTGTTPFSPVVDANVLAFTDGFDLVCYSALTNSFDTVTGFLTPTIFADGDLVIGTDTVALYGFSSMTGTFAPIQFGNFTVTTNETVALAADGATRLGFSPIFNAWIPAPAATYVSASLLRSSIVLGHAGGYEALSARHPSWVSQAVNLPGQVAAPSAHNVFLAEDGPTWHAFDTRLGRWADVAVGGSATASIFRTVAILNEGTTAHGFGLMNNVWESIALQGVVQQVSVASSIAAIVTSSHIYCYTPHGSFSNPTRFPEFSRFLPRGTNLRLIQTGTPGTFILSMVGLKSAYIPFQPFGTIFVDPVDVSTTFTPLGTIPANGIFDLDIPIPDLPFLNDVPLHLQNILVTPSGGLHFTNSTSPIII